MVEEVLNKYYVYGLFDPETNQPFYIGKGTGRRMYMHDFKSNKNVNIYKFNKFKKLLNNGFSKEQICKKIKDNLDEDSAYTIETDLINIFGVWQKGGSLTNISDDGRRPPKVYLYGEKNGMYGKIGELNPFFGKKHSEESKNNMSEAQRTLTAEQLQKIKQLYDEGFSQSQILTKMNLTIKPLFNAFKRLKLKTSYSHLTPELESKIEECFIRGLTHVEICKELDCTMFNIRYFCNKHKCYKKNIKRDFVSEELLNRIKQLKIEFNYDPKTIANMLNCEVKLVYNANRIIKYDNNK